MLSVSKIVKSLAAVALLATAASAATSWTTPAGTAPTFDYSAGQTANGYFTPDSPLFAENKFLFFPSQFAAEAESTPVITDTLSFVLTAKPGQFLKSISTGLGGDYSLLGSGGSVDATAKLKVTNLSTLASFSQNLTFTPSFPKTTGFSLFSGTGLINLPAGWTNAKVELTATLKSGAVPTIVQGEQTFAGLIQLKQGDVTIQTAAVPLPGALIAAPFGIAMAWVARRRMSR